MSEDEIANIVIEEIAKISTYDEADIREMYSPPEKDPKLSDLFSSSSKSLLPPELKRRMKFVKSTALTNELFTSVKTLEQLVKKIKSYESKKQ